MASDVFRIAFVPGVTPDKWLGTWQRRFPALPLEALPTEPDAAFSAVRDGSIVMALLRLPIDREGLHCIPLYDEDPVVVAGKEHLVAAADEVDISDLAEEVLMQAEGEVPEWDAAATAVARERSRAMPRMSMKDAVSVVASGAGVVIVPLSVARLHHRKDVVRRPVSGVARSAVGLVWRIDTEDPRVEDFIGIVRGRTENSSRGQSARAPESTGRTTSGAGSGGRSGSARSAKPGRGAAQHRSSAGARRSGSTRRRRG